MDIQLRRTGGDYIDCVVAYKHTEIDIGLLSKSQAQELLETLEASVEELKRFLGIPDIEEPTVVIHMDEDCLDYVQTSCDMTVIVSDPHSDVGHRVTPEGRNAFIYKTGCEPLERETIDQWKKLV